MKFGRTNSRADKGRMLRILLVLLPCLGYTGVSLPQTAQNYREQATELARAKSWDEAIAAYRKALEIEPRDSLTHYNLALALKYKGDARQAADEFESALRLKPNWADAHYGSIPRMPGRTASWRTFTRSRIILPPQKASCGRHFNPSRRQTCISTSD